MKWTVRVGPKWVGEANYVAEISRGRVGPTTPTRARRLADASVDPTDARKDIVVCFGRSDRSRLVPRNDITADERGAMVRNRLGSGPPLLQGTESGEESAVDVVPL
jgi:hypothetical protein